MTMQKIVPHLWFDKQAKEAAQFYTETFGKSSSGESRVTGVTTLHDTPSGDADTVSFEVWGYKMMAISAGPYFTINPSISFIVGCETQEEIDQLWERLSKEGRVLMPLDTYPFSERYGWVMDRFGVTWQLILVKPEGEERSKIVPSLMFVGENCGRAEEAGEFYRSVFKNSEKGNLIRYGGQEPPNKKDDVMFSDIKIENVWLALMDSALEHKFNFNEAVSLIVYGEDQAEIDYYWEKLSAVPEAEQCGWLKDKFGVSWQVVPRDMDEMMVKGTPEQIKRVTEAFLKMKKFDLAELKRAYEGE